MVDSMWSVAFAGTGDTSQANAGELLDDWLPLQLKHVTLPDRISGRHKGLRAVRDWLATQIDENDLAESPVREIASLLQRHRIDEGYESYLVYIPAEEWDESSDEAKLVRACWDYGIPIKDLTAGLDDFVPPDIEPAKEDTSPRQRGKPRNAELDEESGDVPLGQEQPAARPPGRGSGVTVTLPEATVQALLAALAALANDIKAVTDEPAGGKEKTYPFWVSSDGEYRPRKGRGRGKNSETAVDLTAAEISELGLELPE